MGVDRRKPLPLGGCRRGAPGYEGLCAKEEQERYKKMKNRRK